MTGDEKFLKAYRIATLQVVQRGGNSGVTNTFEGQKDFGFGLEIWCRTT